MNKISRELIVVLLVVMLFTSACGQGNVNSPVTESSPAEDLSGQEGNEAITEEDELDLSISNDENNEQEEEIPVFTSIIFETSLEENSTATAIISPEGGSLTTTAADGTQYTLVVPEGALLYEEEISMTPIASAVGEVIGDSFLGGVKLDPEGLHFLELVSIEVVKPGIKEGAFGFTGQSEGQDFHMIPSTSDDGSVTITTTHFTEFVISQDTINGAIELGKAIGIPLLEHQLANGSDTQQIAALDKMITYLLLTGNQGINLKNWEAWSSEIITFLLRANEITAKKNWDKNTPGFKDLLPKMKNLVELWFQEMEELVQEIAVKCIDGEILYIKMGLKITEAANWFEKYIQVDTFDEKIANWNKKLAFCFNLGISWQANILTTASNFTSDIAIGAEVQNVFDLSNPAIKHKTILEVEYIDGFWEDKCIPKDGLIEIQLTSSAANENFGMNSNKADSVIAIRVNIITQVFIDCGQGYSQILADAQAPFHGAALDRLNSGRVDGDFWNYELIYDPGGGIVGQFEEGPKPLKWSEGTYQLWQLVSLYNTTPPACLYGDC